MKIVDISATTKIGQYSKNFRLRNFDTINNIFNGYEPVFIEGISKINGERYAMKDNNGLRIINWVKEILNGDNVITKIIHQSGLKTSTTRNAKTGNLIERTVQTTNGKTYVSFFRDNKLASLNSNS